MEVSNCGGFATPGTKGLSKVGRTFRVVATPHHRLPIGFPGMSAYAARKTVLIVDDNPDVREICSLALDYAATTFCAPATARKGWRWRARRSPTWW
jgi:hypothetical protein